VKCVKCAKKSDKISASNEVKILLSLKAVAIETLSKDQRKEAFNALSLAVWEHYRLYKRIFSFRQTTNPYHILVSEMMLQQTQVERVEPKYEQFIKRWPTLEALSQASLSEVLQMWKGLGYNRRALALHSIATSSKQQSWQLPKTQIELLTLPQVGAATRAAIMVVAYQQKALYLETNIRRVLLYHFHPHQENVTDATLLAELEELTEMQTDYKHWYYALLDWGAKLKTLVPNPNRRSAQYAKQSPFENSPRQVRAKVLFLLQEKGPLEKEKVGQHLPYEMDRIEKALKALEKEGFIVAQNSSYGITGEL
jgi:A/G-specific adenine glycosylase